MKKDAIFEQLDAIVGIVEDLKENLEEVLGEEKSDSKKSSKKETKKEELEEEPEEDENAEMDIDEVIQKYELSGMSPKDLKAFCDENEIEYDDSAKKKDLIQLIAEAIASGEVTIEDENDEENEDENEEVDLDEMDLDQLLEYAEENEIDLSELKKKDLKNEDKVREVIQAALETSEDGDDEDVPDFDDMDLEAMLEYAEENDIEIPKSAKKSEDKVRALLVASVSTDDDSEEEENEDDEEAFDASEERLAAEDKIKKAIQKDFDKGKLKLNTIKKFLKEYFEEDEDCKECKGCSEDETVECYKRVKAAFVDDEGDTHEEKEGYARNDVIFCCGEECEVNPDDEDQVVCKHCGSTYKEAEE
jgi:hypothetical protein